LRICVFGNQDNSGYRFCLWLRAAGHEAHLYLMQRWESPRSRPEAVDRELDPNAYPSWIHRFDNSLRTAMFRPARYIDVIESQFDVAIVIGSLGMMNAHHLTKIPFVNISTGPSNQGVIKMWDHVSAKHALFWTTVRFFVRKSVARCQKILVHYDPEIYSLGKLGHLGKIDFYGMPEDIAGNRARVDRALLDRLNERYRAYDKVFVWLGRIAFSDPHSPMYKGTDKFVEAAARVAREGENIRLIIGKHGEDYPRLARLIDEKGLSPYVDWMEHMPYWELLTHLSIDNAVVFDELTPLHCVSSGMFRETLSVGGTLVRSYSRVLTQAGHGDGNCPVLDAESADEVYARMREVLSWDDAQTAAWKARVAEWSSRHLDSRVQIGRLVTVLEQVVYAFRTAARLAPWYE